METAVSDVSTDSTAHKDVTLMVLCDTYRVCPENNASVFVLEIIRYNYRHLKPLSSLLRHQKIVASGSAVHSMHPERH